MLKQNSGGLSSLQNGIEKLFDSLLELKGGSDQLLTGSQNLQSGLEAAKAGSNSLLSGSNQLVEANSKIRDGTIQLASGVGLAGQQNEIENVVSQIESEKNDKLAGAFDQDFLLAAIVLIVVSACGLFTDKKTPKE